MSNDNSSEKSFSNEEEKSENKHGHDKARRPSTIINILQSI